MPQKTSIKKSVYATLFELHTMETALMKNERRSPASLSSAQIERRRYLQKRNRRKENLIKKAFQMCILCDTEIFLGIRVKETGQVTTFCSEPTGIWSSSLSCLVRCL
jgi:hypothetical protein